MGDKKSFISTNTTAVIGLFNYYMKQYLTASESATKKLNSATAKHCECIQLLAIYCTNQARSVTACDRG